MKRFLPIIVLLASCQMSYVDSGYKTEGIEFSSFEHAWRAIANYKYELSDYPQAPARTFKRRTGDCLDCALLLGYYSESMGAEVALYNRVQDDRIVGVDAVVRWPQDAWVTAAHGAAS